MKKQLLLGMAVLLLATLACGLPTGNVLFQDDFSDCNNGWPSERDSLGISDCENGVYRILVDTDYNFFWAASGESFDGDVSIQTEATKTSGSDVGDIGIICRYDTDADNFYFLTMGFDGYATIGRWTGEDYTLLADSSDHDFGSSAQTHTLRADCIGNTMTLFVDNVQIISAQDNAYSSGEAGFIVGTYDEPGVDVSFDNFIVSAP